MDSVVTNNKGKVFLKIAAYSTAVFALINVYQFYKNNIWHPKIEVLDVDFDKGVAHLMINGKKFTLRGDSVYLIDSDWGLKFGHTFTKDNKRIYDRIEVIKKDKVHSVIKEAEVPKTANFTANEKTYYEDTFMGFIKPANAKTSW